MAAMVVSFASGQVSTTVFGAVHVLKSCSLVARITFADSKLQPIELATFAAIKWLDWSSSTVREPILTCLEFARSLLAMAVATAKVVATMA